MRAVALVSLFMLALFAGCLGGSKDADEDGGASQSRILDADEASLGGGTTPSGEALDTGEIRGRVVDDVQLPVADAAVSVLGTEAIVRTDGNGSFRFLDVPAGSHTLRVESADYRPEESVVAVKAGRITEVTLVVVGFEDRGPGYRPHQHDLWGSDELVVLMDDELDMRENSKFLSGRPVLAEAYETAVAPNQNISWEIPIPAARADGRPAIILPGTATVTVTVTWDAQDITLSKMGLRYENAASADPHWLAPRASGVAFTIPVGAGEADHGHQSFTLWNFFLYSGNHPQIPGFQPAVAAGAFHVRIDLAKGVLGVDPPHPNYWNESTSIVVRNFTTLYSITVTAPEACESTARFIADDAMIVPPGTQQLRMRLHWQHATLPSGYPSERSWTLRWKPADLHPSETAVADYQTQPPSGGSGATLEYTVPVQPAQTDAYYQTKSNWAFAATTANAALGQCSASGTGLGIATTGVQALFTRFQLEVIADKDPGFA